MATKQNINASFHSMQKAIDQLIESSEATDEATKKYITVLEDHIEDQEKLIQCDKDYIQFLEHHNKVTMVIAGGLILSAAVLSAAITYLVTKD